MSTPITTPGQQDWREDEDGTPHLSYFAEQTSFVWSGSAERPIQVCDGAAGEPVTDTIDPTKHITQSEWVDLRPLGLLSMFKDICDTYLRARAKS